MSNCECNEACKIDKCLDTKICSCKGCLFGNLEFKKSKNEKIKK